MSYCWEALADGGGRLSGHFFHIDQATPSEARELRETLGKIRNSFYEDVLLNFKKDKTWKEAWENWNHIFPDRYIPSIDAMRKRVAYYKNPKTGRGDSIPPS